MTSDKLVNAKEIPGTARNILLIDWPNADVPKILLEEGFTVFCYSPGGYTRAKIQKGHLVFHKLYSIPGPVDIVNVYRPEQEHADIISKHTTIGSKSIMASPANNFSKDPLAYR